VIRTVADAVKRVHRNTRPERHSRRRGATRASHPEGGGLETRPELSGSRAMPRWGLPLERAV